MHLSSSSSWSPNQPFSHRDELRYLIFTPDLAEDFVASFYALLEALPADNALTAATVKQVHRALEAYQGWNYLDYGEQEVQDAHKSLLRGLLELVPPLDVLLGVVTNSTGCIQTKKRIPAVDPLGRPVLNVFRPKLTLYRVVQADWRPVVTLEVRAPHASHGCAAPSEDAGLHVRAVKAIEERGVLELDELEELEVRAFFRKGIVSARTLGTDLFLCADGYSWFVCLVLPTGEGTAYDVLVSRLARIVTSPPSSQFCVIHLLTYFMPLLDLGKIRDKAQAKEYRPPPPSQRLEARSTKLVQGEARWPSQEQATWGNPEANPTNALSGSDASLLLSQLSDQITVVLPEGTAFTAFRSPLVNESTPSAAHVDRFQVDALIGLGATSQVYSLFLDGEAHVLKLGNRKVEEDLECEIEFLRGIHDKPALRGTVVPLRAVYRDRDGRAMLLMPYAGEALQDWSTLSKEQRISLVVALLRLHQLGKIEHGDLAAEPAHH
ncbi:hypothetical protein JCM10450v2_007522 [Rhodotorula kratochvilovae]